MLRLLLSKAKKQRLELNYQLHPLALVPGDSLINPIDLNQEYNLLFLWYFRALKAKAHNKLLNFVPATNSVASTGLPTLRFGSQLAKR